MIVRRFLLWARTASTGHRAEAVGALAKAYLYGDLTPEDRWEAETALTAMLDDPSSVVRRVLAETFAASAAAPRHIVVALAGDQSDIAAIVLGRSPLLLDCDLIDCAALGDGRIQCAIAARARLPPTVAAALAEVAGSDALVVLARNPGAEIADFSLSRIVERFGEMADLREALLARTDLPVEIAQAIMAALARSLERFVTGCGWLSVERGGRVTREARERTTVALSARAGGGDGVERLVAHLRRSGQLTPALILRAVLSRELAFVEAAFADLSGFAPQRVAAVLRDRRGGAFRALYAKANLPPALRAAFEAALSAYRESGTLEPSLGARLSRRMIERALTACEALPAEESGKLFALLRRFESEAAREEARRIADDLADEAALELVLQHAPHALLEDHTNGRPLAA